MIAYRTTTPPKAPRPEPVLTPKDSLWPVWYQPPVRRAALDLPKLMREVANDFNITPCEIKSPSRVKPHVLARMVIAKVLRERGWSVRRVGQVIDRDPKTLRVNLEKADTYERHYPQFRLSLDKARRMYA